MLSKFIDAEIDPKQDNIKDPIKKLINNKTNLSYVISNNKLAIGIEIKNGIWTKIKWEIVFKILISS